MCYLTFSLIFSFNDTAPTEIYTLSLHDALPICRGARDAIALELAGELGDGRALRVEDDVLLDPAGLEEPQDAQCVGRGLDFVLAGPELARAAPDQGQGDERRATPHDAGVPARGGAPEDPPVGGDLDHHASAVERRRGGEDLPDEHRGEHGSPQGQGARKRTQPHDSTSVTLNLWYTERPGGASIACSSRPGHL